METTEEFCDVLPTGYLVGERLPDATVRALALSGAIPASYVYERAQERVVTLGGLVALWGGIAAVAIAYINR